MDPKVCHIDGKIQELEFPDLKRNKTENDIFTPMLPAQHIGLNY